MSQADRDRLAARVNSEYENFGYAEIFYGDTDAVAAVEADVVGNSLSADASAASALSDVAQTEFDKRATKNSGQAISQAIAAVNDRVVGRRPNDTRVWPMVRSTKAWGWGPTGVLEEAAIDTLKWDFHETTRASLGLAFAGARTNLVVNPYFEGGTPGVIGAGGVLPTNIVLGSALPGGMQMEFVGLETLANGEPSILMRWFGSTTPGEYTRLVFGMPSGTVFTSGEAITLSMGYSLAAGSLTGFSGSANAYVFRPNGFSSTPAVPNAAVPTGVVQRAVYSGTLTAGVTTSTTSFGPQLLGLWNSGAAIDATFRYVNPQFQRSAFNGPPVFPPVGTPGISTRAQGNVSIPLPSFGGRFNPRQGTLIVSWSSYAGAFTSAADTDFFGIISLGDLGANEVMGLLINPAHTAALFRRTVGGVVQSSSTITITAPTAGQSVKFAMAWNADAGLMQVAARGAAGTKLSGEFSIPLMTHLMPGRFSTTRPLFGQIDGVELWPLAVFDSALATKT